MNKIIPNSEQDYVAHLKGESVNTCLVCDSSRLSGSWTDYNGQIRCSTCGMTYQILGSHHTEEFLKEHGLKKEEVARQYCDAFSYIPLARAYFQETKRRLPFGSYFGGSPIPEADYRDFYSWVAKNADVLRPAWEEYFTWDKLAG